jgi:hypothetical protein
MGMVLMARGNRIRKARAQDLCTRFVPARKFFFRSPGTF